MQDSWQPLHESCGAEYDSAPLAFRSFVLLMSCTPARKAAMRPRRPDRRAPYSIGNIPPGHTSQSQLLACYRAPRRTVLLFEEGAILSRSRPRTEAMQDIRSSLLPQLPAALPQLCLSWYCSSVQELPGRGSPSFTLHSVRAAFSLCRFPRSSHLRFLFYLMQKRQFGFRESVMSPGHLSHRSHPPHTARTILSSGAAASYMPMRDIHAHCRSASRKRISSGCSPCSSSRS